MDVVSAADGKVIAEMTVEDEHTNAYGTLAGGMAVSLVDGLSAFSLWTLDGDKAIVGGVSINLNVNFLNPAKIGDRIVIESTATKRGTQISYLHVDMFEKTTRKIICTGEHILFNQIRGNPRDFIGYM